MPVQSVINTILFTSMLAVLGCNTDANQARTSGSSPRYDTVVSNKPKKGSAKKKRPSKPIDFNRKLDARVLGTMLSWESFDYQKYLMTQGFDLLAGGKKIDYLWREPDFGFPEQVRDSAVFQRTDDAGTLRIKILTEYHYNYSDEQRHDMYHYKGNPKEYPDRFNAKDVSPAYNYQRLRLYTSSRAIALNFIEQFESLGCKFEKDILLEFVQEQLEESIPNYERPKEISNTCSCPEKERKTFNDASIAFTTNFESDRPAYRISLDISSL